MCLLFAPALGIGLCESTSSTAHGDVPLQTLQHRPSGNIWSPRVQLSSGHVSVIFNIRPFWKDRTEAERSGKHLNGIIMLIYSGRLAQLFSHFNLWLTLWMNDRVIFTWHRPGSKTGRLQYLYKISHKNNSQASRGITLLHTHCTLINQIYHSSCCFFFLKLIDRYRKSNYTYCFLIF